MYSQIYKEFLLNNTSKTAVTGCTITNKSVFVTYTKVQKCYDYYTVPS